DPALDTADYTANDGPGGLRVDYVLPGAGLQVVDAGVLWPPPGTAAADMLARASRHRPVWVDLKVP
ncbi:MAG: endonuclease/exonuclease/phosphatase family protein, partial [Paracoccaceae bacterium]|nr:endonuclease/exonuclease/phosphatase family protein [Paracoccaceae bacterium]